MATNGKTKDKYANMLIASVTESAANTLTFEQLPQITTLMEKKAYLISRIEYDWPNDLLVAAADYYKFGVSMKNSFTTGALSEATIIDYNAYRSNGVAVEIYGRIHSSDFSTLPGGGLLIPTRPMYLWAQGASLASAGTVTMKMYFTVADLSPEDYWDLVEAMQAYS